MKQAARGTVATRADQKFATATNEVPTMATKTAEKGEALAKAITVRAPNLQTIELHMVGTAPYVQHKFSEKGKAQIMATQAAGSAAKSKRTREAKDFDKTCEAATHYSRQGWVGMHAGAFRNAMISACRLVGFKMTLAKLAVMVEADGFDRDDGSPLVRIFGKPRRHDAAVRNDNGSIDIRSRPMWEQWAFKIRVRFDADVFTAADIANLMVRVGAQVGIGEGRNDSKDSAGIGWGSFTSCSPEEFQRFVDSQEAEAA